MHIVKSKELIKNNNSVCNKGIRSYCDILVNSTQRVRLQWLYNIQGG